MTKIDTLLRAGNRLYAADPLWVVSLRRPIGQCDPIPNVAAHFLVLGHALGEQGRHAAASAAYQDALALRPDWAEAFLYLGQALLRQGQLQAALHALQSALRLQPDFPAALSSLAVCLDAQDRLEEALLACLKAVELEPGNPRLHANTGAALLRLNRAADAIPACEAAIRLDPACAAAHSNLGNALLGMDRAAEALAPSRTAVRLDPDRADHHVNLGGVLAALDQPVAAMASYQQALRRDPQHAAAHSHVAVLLESLGRLDDAIDVYQSGLQLHPDFVELRVNHAMALLKAGRFSQGFAGYEWRWRQPHMSPRDFAQPQWAGEDLAGRTILLHAEQGFGDTLQFARYVPMVAARGGRVILEVPAPLAALMSALPGVASIVVRGDALPEFDTQCPLLSLPRAFATRLDTIPADIPYLASPCLTGTGGQHDRTDGTLRIGLAWAGDPRRHDMRANQVDRRRSIALAQLAPLFTIPGITWFSLQKGDAAGQSRGLGTGVRIIDDMDRMQDFADTASLVATLDLVISVDTAVAHLAGGMGKPVWLLSRFDGCWRWLRDRDDSPWYPAMRLFRQNRPGDWAPVVERVRRALAGLPHPRPR